MIAVFANWWKQYQVKAWDEVILEKIEKKDGEVIEIKQVLLTFDDKDYKSIDVGKPFTKNVIKAEIIESWKWEKIKVFKMKAKKRYSTNKWHRQPYTKIKILSIA